MLTGGENELKQIVQRWWSFEPDLVLFESHEFEDISMVNCGVLFISVKYYTVFYWFIGK